MNDFMKDKGWIVNRDLEKYAKRGDFYFIPDLHNMTLEEADTELPERIRGYIKDAMTRGDIENGRDKTDLN